ncbi:MAG: hypothetical protein H6704_04825 [Myxococcales bacterium]|nr:hypothetical protein [Myxococcales bacterium]
MRSVAMWMVAAMGMSAGCKADEAPAPAASPAADAAPAAPAARPFADAVACVQGERLDQGCPGWVALRGRVKTDADALLLEARAALAAGGAPRLIAAHLLSDASLAPGDDGVRRALLEALDEPEGSAELKAALLRALGPRATSGVVRQALQMADIGKDPVRAAALTLVARAADKAPRDSALSVARAGFASAEPPLVRRAAAEVLGALADEAMLQPLVNTLDDEMVGSSAAMAISRLRSDAAWFALLKRVQAAADGNPLPPPVVVALARMQKHPAYDEKALKAALEAAMPALTEAAAKDRRAALTLTVARRIVGLPPEVPPAAPR